MPSRAQQGKDGSGTGKRGRLVPETGRCRNGDPQDGPYQRWRRLACTLRPGL